MGPSVISNITNIGNLLATDEIHCSSKILGKKVLYVLFSFSGITAMSLLGELGRTKMLKRLSELGVLLYHQDAEGQAAIHRAVRNVNIIEVLLKPLGLCFHEAIAIATVASPTNGYH